jgi:hypothetical protein
MTGDTQDRDVQTVLDIIKDSLAHGLVQGSAPASRSFEPPLVAAHGCSGIGLAVLESLNEPIDFKTL